MNQLDGARSRKFSARAQLFFLSSSIAKKTAVGCGLQAAEAKILAKA
jgi:hypothetical protein